MTWEPTGEEVQAYIAAALAKAQEPVPSMAGMQYEQRRDEIAAAGLRAAYGLLRERVERVEHLAAGLQARAEEAERPDRATQHLPDHNYTMPHDQRFRPYDIRHCPPNCPYRLAVQARKSQS